MVFTSTVYNIGALCTLVCSQGICIFAPCRCTKLQSPGIVIIYNCQVQTSVFPNSHFSNT